MQFHFYIRLSGREMTKRQQRKQQKHAQRQTKHWRSRASIAMKTAPPKRQVKYAMCGIKTVKKEIACTLTPFPFDEDDYDGILNGNGSWLRKAKSIFAHSVAGEVEDKI